MKVFYSHLVIVDDVIKELSAWEIPDIERDEMHKLIEETLHHHTLNVILNHLPAGRHQEFLDIFEKSPESSELMAILKKEIQTDIESAIKTQSERIKKEILLEIRRSKKS